MANEWGWPFSGGYNGYEEGQQFGMTSFERHLEADFIFMMVLILAQRNIQILRLKQFMPEL